MTHNYNITGMTCSGCVAKAKNELLKLGDITEANVQLAAPQATITMQRHIPVDELQRVLNKAGNYMITEAESGMHHVTPEEKTSWWRTYKPILMIGAYITGITVLIEASKGSFNVDTWMTNFMAGFFLAFSFFKLLDLKGFAESYATYDVIARNWRGWGYMYAFVELLLGLAYLFRFNLLLTSMATFLVMSISIVGVLQSILNKRKIKCACLGAVFDLPMSTITVIEDAVMILMSAITITSLL